MSVFTAPDTLMGVHFRSIAAAPGIAVAGGGRGYDELRYFIELPQGRSRGRTENQEKRGMTPACAITAHRRAQLPV